MLERAGIAEALASGKYEVFSFDIGPMCQKKETFSINGIPRAVPASEPISEDEYISLSRRNVEWLKSGFDGRLQVENNNYLPTGAYDRICDPDFICALVEEADIDLLLDLGHVEICAYYMAGWGADSYIESLPLERVYEVHLSHAGLLNGVFEDLHEIPNEEDLATACTVLRAGHNAETLTVEYYRDAAVLVAFYRKLSHTALELIPWATMIGVCIFWIRMADMSATTRPSTKKSKILGVRRWQSETRLSRNYVLAVFHSSRSDVSSTPDVVLGLRASS